jgi:hypothetical protein
VLDGSKSSSGYWEIRLLRILLNLHNSVFELLSLTCGSFSFPTWLHFIIQQFWSLQSERTDKTNSEIHQNGHCWTSSTRNLQTKYWKTQLFTCHSFSTILHSSTLWNQLDVKFSFKTKRILPLHVNKKIVNIKGVLSF